MIEIKDIKRELEETEKLIEITRKTKEDAIKASTESSTKIEISKSELAKLGVTPENAEETVKVLEAEIEELLNEIKDSIPYDLLRELKRID